MSTYLIRNAKIVNEGVVFEGDILIENEWITEIAEKISPKYAQQNQAPGNSDSWLKYGTDMMKNFWEY